MFMTTFSGVLEIKGSLEAFQNVYIFIIFIFLYITLTFGTLRVQIASVTS